MKRPVYHLIQIKTLALITFSFVCFIIIIQITVNIFHTLKRGSSITFPKLVGRRTQNSYFMKNSTKSVTTCIDYQPGAIALVRMALRCTQVP